MFDRWPRFDITYRLVVAVVGTLVVVVVATAGSFRLVHAGVAAVTLYNGVTGLRRLRDHRRGQHLAADPEAWLAARSLLPTTGTRVLETWTSADGWLEVVGVRGGRETHQVCVDDWIAHLHGDVVQQFVAAVGSRDAVREAWQEDREVVSLVAPRMRADVLGREAHAFFRARISPSQARLG